MTNKKPRGYFDKILAFDTETTGLAFNGDDPSIEADGSEYQVVSIGLIVADAITLKPIDELYVEIQWDGQSNWNDRAEKIHGLSKKYLKENGMTTEEAVCAIGNFIFKYWPDNNICTLGHNVVSFDIPFLKRLMRKCDLELRFGNRHVCTNAIGFVNWETYNSDDLFDIAGVIDDERNLHNSLEDARCALEVARISRVLFKSLF